VKNYIYQLYVENYTALLKEGENPEDIIKAVSSKLGVMLSSFSLAITFLIAPFIAISKMGYVPEIILLLWGMITYLIFSRTVTFLIKSSNQILKTQVKGNPSTRFVLILFLVYMLSTIWVISVSIHINNIMYPK